MEDKPSIMASTAEDSNLIDESYSFNRVEDLTNGLPESYTIGPASISTYVMITLLLIGIISLLHLLQEDLQVPDQAERVWQWCGSHSEERFCGIKPHQGTAKIPQSKHRGDQVESGWGGAGREGLQDPGHHRRTEGGI